MRDLKDGLRLWVAASHDLRVTLLCRKTHQFRSQAEGRMFKTHLDFQIICIRTSIQLTQPECVSGGSFIWVEVQSIKWSIDLYVNCFNSGCNSAHIWRWPVWNNNEMDSQGKWITRGLETFGCTVYKGLVGQWLGRNVIMLPFWITVDFMLLNWFYWKTVAGISCWEPDPCSKSKHWLLSLNVICFTNQWQGVFEEH